MLKIVFFILISAILFGCAPRHSILGTDYGWNQVGIQILVDAQIDKLKIRHVRMPNNQCVSGFQDHLEIQGEIGPDSTEAVERLLPRLHKCVDSNGTWRANAVYLSSGGGMLYDGYRMGNLFRKYHVQTVITGNQQCASSCAIAFLGGYYRRMEHNALLLFHAPYVQNGIAIDCLDRGQVDELRDFYNSNLGSQDGQYLFERSMSYCSSTSGWTLNADGAKLFNITNN